MFEEDGTEESPEKKDSQSVPDLGEKELELKTEGKLEIKVGDNFGGNSEDEPMKDIGQESFNKLPPDKPANFANEPAKETSSIDEQNDPEEIGTDT